MASEWRNCTLGDVLTLQRGFDLPAHERLSGVYPIIASTGEVGTHSKAMVKAPGVVIGRSGSLGGGQYVTHDFWPLNTTLWVNDFKGNDIRFCYYLLKSIDFSKFNVGGAVPTLNRNHVHPLPVRVPGDISEQRAIAYVLGALDDKIELNRRTNETLEAIARALYRAWFVDFEPVRAKLEGRWQRGQTLPGLPAHLYDLFPERLVESELGEIPEGWQSVPASQLIDFNPSEPLRKGTEAPYIEMASLPTNGCWPEPPVSRPFGSGMRFRNGDTLLARITPCLENGKTAFVQGLPDNSVGWGSTEYIVMRTKAPVPSEFAYLLARDDAFREQAIRSMTGTSGRQRVQADSVAAFKLASPPNQEVWNAVSHAVVPQFKSIKANAQTIETLAQLRDTLLPKLISGELRVPDAKHMVGAVV